MSNIQGPGGPSTDGPSMPAAAVVHIPWAVQRIRRQLYWQAAFGLLRASFGLLVILLVVRSPASVAAVVGVAVFVARVALAVASIVLARQVTSRRRSTRMVIIGLEAVVGVIYGLLTVQAVAGFAAGGALAAVTFNAIGLLIACNVLRHATAHDAGTWFDRP